jgi:transposase
VSKSEFAHNIIHSFCGYSIYFSSISRPASIFVAVLGAFNYTFAEATRSQSLPDWLGSHARTFEFFGGTPQLLVLDNLKSGVSKACRYEPELNPAYQLSYIWKFFVSKVAPMRPYTVIVGKRAHG